MQTHLLKHYLSTGIVLTSLLTSYQAGAGASKSPDSVDAAPEKTEAMAPTPSAPEVNKTGGFTTNELQNAVDEAYANFKDLTEGKNADYIPILTETPSDLFGVVIATKDGQLFTAGDIDYKFSIQSVSKPFTAALVMQQQNPQTLVDKIGVEPTGLPFNSRLALEIYDDRSVNPLVNAGAIAAVSLVQAESEDDRWNQVLANLEGFAGTKLDVLEKVYDSEYETAWGNRAIANLLFNYERLYCEPEEALRVYTRQCSVGVSAKDLAMMGATLANNGVNPLTGKEILDSRHIPEMLAIMATAGFYDESGEWMATAGLPAKTGVGGGIVAVVPGKFAIAAFSPRLNGPGNSIKSMKAIREISGRLGLGVYGANPE